MRSGLGRTGFGDRDGTRLDNLGNLGMVVLFIGTGIRVLFWDSRGRMSGRYDAIN